MARIHAITSTFVLGILISAPALAEDTGAAQASGAVNDASGGYSTDATDRGGRPAPTKQLDAGAMPLLEWLTGLVD